VLNISIVDGMAVDGGDLVWPMQTSLGMGFSWATYFAQQVSIRMLRKAISPVVSTELNDDVGVWVLKRCQNLAAHYAYIDNLGILNTSVDVVTEVVERAKGVFVPAGLELHEVEIYEGGGEALGIVLDGTGHRTMNTLKRFGRLRQALNYVMSLRRISGCVLEVVIGHCTYFGLVNRDVLSVFSSVYRFIHQFYDKPSPHVAGGVEGTRSIPRYDGFCCIGVGMAMVKSRVQCRRVPLGVWYR
jgi:hypothetical protein